MNNPAAGPAAIWLFLVTGLFAVASYYPGLAGDYMFDDRENLLDNPRLAIDSLDMESLRGAAFSSGSGQLRRPVSMLSFALNRYFFGVAPYSYKVVNLAIHLLTGLGLFLLSRLLVRHCRQFRSPGLSETAVIWLPVVVTGLWLVHPLNLTSVLYIVQRMASLSALFTVYGLYLYVIGRQRMLAGKHGLALILAGFFVFGGLALFSKENGALLPLFMLTLEVALFHFRNHEGQLDKVVTAFFMLILVAPVLFILTHPAINPADYLNYDGRNFTLAERVLTEARVLVFYLKLMAIPSITELGLYHDDIALSRGLLDPPTTLYSLITLTGLLLGAFLLLGKRPLVSLGLLWFFVAHALESTIFPLEIAHEHRNYLADYGIILAATSAVAQAPLGRLGPAIRTVMPLLFLFLFSFTTWLRAGQWSDNINHAVYEAQHHPESFRSVFAAGRIHARLTLNGHAESEEKAYAYLRKASILDKTGIMPETMLIKLSYLLGKPVDQKWFDTILQKLSRFPLTPSDLSSLQALASCIGGQCNIPHETMEAIFEQALKNESAELVAIYGYYTINKRGNFDKGLELFKRAVELDPREPQRRINLINLLTVMGRFDEAEQQLALFRAGNTHGGNEGDYSRLQEAIDAGRKEYMPTPRLENSENG